MNSKLTDARIAELEHALQTLCQHGGAMAWLEMHAPYIRRECEAALPGKSPDEEGDN